MPGSALLGRFALQIICRAMDEMFNGEIFYSLHEAQILTKQWRKHNINGRPHSALGFRPPTPETIVSMDRGPVMH